MTSSIAAGVFYALAAGNDNIDACTTSPASTPLAMTVGATTNTDARAGFSNWGTCLDLFGPGVAITSAWIGSDNATATINGTSMAAPHVAGVAALYLNMHPADTPAEVTTALLDNATPDLVTSPGTGSPNRLLYSGGLNEPPTADAGEDQALECAAPAGTGVTLDGTGSSDPDGDALSFSWSEGGTEFSTDPGPLVTRGTGTHTFVLKVMDPALTSDTDEVEVAITDTQAPALTLLGADPLVLGVGGVYTEPGATALDACRGALSPAIDASAVNTGVPGLYTVYYRAEDSDGNAAEDERTVEVVAALVPVLKATLTAKAPPVVIGPEGGKVRFNLKVKNTSTTKQRFRGWFVVSYPDGREIVLFTGIRAVLQPGRHRGWLGELNVPGDAPSGPYTLTGLVGTFPDGVVDQDAISFVKNPPSAGKHDEAGERITAWQVVDEATGREFVTVEEEIEEAVAEAPSAFSLEPNYPNPFNPATTIPFALAEQGRVHLAVYDVLGRQLAVLAEGVMAAGRHEATFEAAGLPSGMYLVRFEAGGQVLTRHLTLLR